MSTILPSHNEIFSDYVPIPGVYDELLNDTGKVRQYARSWVESLNKLGPNELSHRYQHAQRLVHEKGLGQRGYAAKSTHRP